MEIKTIKTTLYVFDHPTEGYACQLRVDRIANGFIWRLSSRPRRSDRDWHANICARTDLDGFFVTFECAPEEFSIREDHDDGMVLFFNDERVYLD